MIISRKLIPGWAHKLLIRVRGRNIYFDGPYDSWETASNESSGYDELQIIQKIVEANELVQNGQASFSRDGVLFDSPSYRWPVLASLLSSTNSGTGRLQVIDFGGSLGEFYVQHKAFLGSVAANGWCVVEQKHYTHVGKESFQNGPVVFHNSLHEAATEMPPDVLLLSSVLQYLHNPYDVIKTASNLNIKTIIIDRTPMSRIKSDQVFVQRVPAAINRASYPSWVFSESGFIDRVTSLGYSVFSHFNCPEQTHLDCKFKGYVLRKTA